MDGECRKKVCGGGKRRLIRAGSRGLLVLGVEMLDGIDPRIVADRKISGKYFRWYVMHGA